MWVWVREGGGGNNDPSTGGASVGPGYGELDGALGDDGLL